MLRSLYTAASGMKANQLYIDTISNNLSNVNTTGFKKSRVDFEDLVYQTLQEPGGIHQNGASRPSGVEVGLGVAPVSTTKIYTQGNMTATNKPTDMVIQGDGFMKVRLPSGEIKYTRDGSFGISGDGYLVNNQGYSLEPAVQIPLNSKDAAAGGLTIGEDGGIFVKSPGSDTQEQVGQIELTRFINPAGLKSIGNNLYEWNDAAGQMIEGKPGENGMGTIRSGFLEASNVQMVEEMVSMIIAQRAYEINSKAITTSDEMLQTANQLKR